MQKFVLIQQNFLTKLILAAKQELYKFLCIFFYITIIININNLQNIPKIFVALLSVNNKNNEKTHV
jgi:hypothetical protein